MVDDGRLRFRRSTGAATTGDHGLEGPHYDPNKDPLAELAKLIGHRDPLGEIARPAAGGYPEEPPQRSWPSAAHEQPPGHYSDELRRPAPASGREYRYGHEHDTGQHDPRLRDPTREDFADRYRSEPSDPFYGREADAYPARRSDDNNNYAYAEPAADPDEDWRARRAVDFDQPYDPRYDDASREAADDGRTAEYYAREDDERDADGRYLDEAEELAPERRKSGLVTIIAILGLAVLGTAGAFGYRAYYGGSNAPPPIIRADGNPNKIVPPSRSADTARRPDATTGSAPGERIVSREEKPLPVSETPRPAAPRIVPITRTDGMPSVNSFADQRSPGVAVVNTPGANEPRRVRTTTIRPDGSSIDAAANVPPTRSAAARPVAPPPQATRATAAALANAAAPNAPQAAVAAPAAPPVRQASRAPAADAGSGYFVQISAQKSEEEAQASFRSIQGKFPNLLGNREPVIRRKDLGSRGVYYGAQVGPFAGREEANGLCESLKSQGGTCIVQRN